ncbi:MAG TPA: hypothetical protein VF920_00950 [Dongiaceae bacterium]
MADDAKPVAIEIPIEIGAFRAFAAQCRAKELPKQHITLPISASASFGKLFLALLCFLPAVGFLMIPYAVVFHSHDLFSHTDERVAVGIIAIGWISFLAVVATLMSAFLVLGALLQIVELTLRGPSLLIEADGFRDLRRSPELIPWSDVAFYEGEGSGSSGRTGIKLFLRHAAPADQSRLHRVLLSLIQMKRTPEDQMRINLVALTQPVFVLQQAMKYLIDHHGGQQKYWYN